MRSGVGGAGMSRLEHVSAADLDGRLTSKYAAEVLASDRLSDLYATLGNSPEMLSAWLDFAWDLRFVPTSPRALRELLILLVGARRSAPYCIAAHRRMAVAESVPQAKIDAVVRWRDADCFDATERACLALADAMLVGAVEDSTLQDVIDLLGEAQAVEIVLTVAFYMMVAAVTTTFDLQPTQEPSSPSG